MSLLTELENLFWLVSTKMTPLTGLGEAPARHGGDEGEGISAAPAEMGGRNMGRMGSHRAAAVEVRFDLSLVESASEICSENHLFRMQPRLGQTNGL